MSEGCKPYCNFLLLFSFLFWRSRIIVFKSWGEGIASRPTKTCVGYEVVDESSAPYTIVAKKPSPVLMWTSVLYLIGVHHKELKKFRANCINLGVIMLTWFLLRRHVFASHQCLNQDAQKLRASVFEYCIDVFNVQNHNDGTLWDCNYEPKCFGVHGYKHNVNASVHTQCCT